MFDSTSIPILEQVVNFTQARHTVLAGNMANLDTPGYRTRDLSPDAFQGRLREAIRTRDRQSQAASLGNPVRHGDPFAQVGDHVEGMLRHDDGNVGVEQQITEIAKNHMQHNLALSLLTSQFRLLGAAITERA